MQREILISPHENAKVIVTVTEQMEKDYRECERMAEQMFTDEYKDCDTCSWNCMRLGDTSFCELEEMQELLKEE